MSGFFFSIIIPCFNHGHYLPKCLDSLLTQSFSDWEAIIVDDGSTDDSLKRALELSQTEERIKVFTKANGGLSSARNFGLEQASGHYLIFLDSDDFLLDGCLSKLYHVIGDGHNFISFGFKIFDHELKGSFYARSLPEYETNFSEMVFIGNPGPVHSFCISKDLVSLIGGGFDENLKSAEDWDFWVRIGKTGQKVKNIPDLLVGYRYNSAGMSKNPQVMFLSCVEVINRIASTDSRIRSSVAQVIPNDLNLNQLKKNHFLQYLGVSIVNDPILAKKWFISINEVYNFTFPAHDFGVCNNILTFRYQYMPDQLNHILSVIRNKFKQFFISCGYSTDFIKAADLHIFHLHIKNFNLQKYGQLGRLFNYVLDKRLKLYASIYNESRL